MSMPCYLWSVAIFSSREDSATLLECLSAVFRVAHSAQPVAVDLIVNGNQALGTRMAADAKVMKFAPNIDFRIWFIPLGDKAHAINEYLHRIRPDSDIGFFIDGYVRLRADSLSALALALESSPAAFGASGVPTVGRSAGALREEMMRNGGIHGNLFALNRRAIAKIIEFGFRLPLGLYRTDSLIRAAACFDFDPPHATWNSDRIAVCAYASWDLIHPSGPWMTQLSNVYKRRLRQAQGELENFALKAHLALERKPLSQLPACANDLVNDWHARHAQDFWRRVVGNPLVLAARRKLKSGIDRSLASGQPRLLFSNR